MNIIIYTKKGCPWCNEVIDLLNKKDVPFEEREVRSNQQFFDELVQKSNQHLTPTLDIDGEIIADSDAKEVARCLKDKGVVGFCDC